MKQEIVSKWNFMRFLRLGLGIFIIIQSVIAQDWTMGVLGTVLTIMPVFNIGCCGARGCARVTQKRNSDTAKDITYEEVV